MKTIVLGFDFVISFFASCAIDASCSADSEIIFWSKNEEYDPDKTYLLIYEHEPPADALAFLREHRQAKNVNFFRLRANGKWITGPKNITFASRLGDADELPFVICDFLVSLENPSEVPEFLRH